jgi:uncharacterized damage-inducible protein DinB
MLTITLRKLFSRDLNKLKLEIESYQDEKKIWYTEKSINNSAGNLCLHLVGNLNAYIGAVLGNSGYVRERDLEFTLKDIPRPQLVRSIEETIAIINTTLESLKEESLGEEYPVLVLKEKTSTEYFLIHLATHLGYHLGQVNYHRRLLDQHPA